MKTTNPFNDVYGPETRRRYLRSLDSCFASSKARKLEILVSILFFEGTVHEIKLPFLTSLFDSNGGVTRVLDTVPHRRINHLCCEAHKKVRPSAKIFTFDRLIEKK